MVEVTENDKEIAAELAHALGMTAEEFTSGACDVLVQIATRHRQAGVQQGLDMAAGRAFQLGDRVTKTKGSSWTGMIEALKPFAHYYRLNDCEGRPDDDAIEVPIGDLRFAALALAAKGDSRG